MTTLSKEEFKLLLSNSVASPDLNKVQDAIADLVAENERLKSIPMKYRRMAFNAELQDETDKLRTALAAAEAKNMQLSADFTIHYAQSLNVARLLIESQAREEKLRATIDAVLSDAEECEDPDGWLANLVSCEAIHQLDEALAQPRDDSAPREMIAGVYEECANKADERKAQSRNSLVRSGLTVLAGDFRALAEKARHGN